MFHTCYFYRAKFLIAVFCCVTKEHRATLHSPWYPCIPIVSGGEGEHFWVQVPELWERYAKEVDAEQEMWLNSFIKSPLVIPMPPELEYAWGKGSRFS